MKSITKVGWRRARAWMVAALALSASCAGAPSETSEDEDSFGGGISEEERASGEIGAAASPVSGEGATGGDPVGAFEPAATAANPGVERSADALYATADYTQKVTIRLKRAFAGSTISFGLPLAPGRVTAPTSLRFSVNGAPVAANVKTLLDHFDANGARTSAASVLVQMPSSVMGSAAEVDLVVQFAGGAGPAPGAATVPFAQASSSSAETIRTATRTIVASGGVNKLVDGAVTSRTLFSGREPMVLAKFPEGYLAQTGLLGEQVSWAQAHAAENAGLAFLSDAARSFGLSAMYGNAYAAHPASVIDPATNYEGWLYDRCATFLSLYSHTGDEQFLRHGLRSCSYYGSKIDTRAGTSTFGICTIKASPDIKYSHLRGLYAYYAMTGDEAALAAGKAIADMWLNEPTFVVSYRAGKIRGFDKLWTERLLGTAFEGIFYGHRLTGDPKFLAASREIVTTAFRHITGDASVLTSMNPGVGPFPAQNCFIHSSLQHGEGAAADPWCSSWMSELLVDGLLRYQRQTNDARVDDIFIRLARFVRDVGSQYKTANPLDDRFLAPKACYGGGARKLVPIYGSGLRANGTRANFGEWDDDEHCPDATALTAAAIRALKRKGGFDANPVGPFPSEGASFVQMHHEFAHCSKKVLETHSRPRRDPAAWTSAQLAAGVANPAAFIDSNKIGYPTHLTTPQRKISWWLNMSLLQFGLLKEAGVQVPALAAGKIQPGGCAN